MRRSLNKHHMLWIAGIILVLIHCSNKNEIPSVAKVGPESIPISEFKRTYKDVMLRTNQVDSQKARRNHVQLLIQTKLLSLAGRNLPLDSVAQNELKFAREEALRKALFQTQITSITPSISEEEVYTNFQWLNRQIRFRHIFSQSKSAIDSIALIIGQDTTLYVKLFTQYLDGKNPTISSRDMGWVDYNLLDPALETVAFSIKPGKISSPVRSAYGWHLLFISNRRDQVFLTEEDYQKEHDWLLRQVRRKKQQVLADHYVNTLMTSLNIKIDPQLVPRVLSKTKSTLAPELNPDSIQMGLTSWQKEHLQADLKELWNEPLASFSGFRFTVGDFFQGLVRLPANILYNDLLTGFYRLLRDKVLVWEAERRGLESHPLVIARIQSAKDDGYAFSYLRSILGQQTRHIPAKNIQKITDSLATIFPVVIDTTVLDTLFESSPVNKP